MGTEIRSLVSPKYHQGVSSSVPLEPAQPAEYKTVPQAIEDVRAKISAVEVCFSAMVERLDPYLRPQTAGLKGSSLPTTGIPAPAVVELNNLTDRLDTLHLQILEFSDRLSL